MDFFSIKKLKQKSLKKKQHWKLNHSFIQNTCVIENNNKKNIVIQNNKMKNIKLCYL